MSWITIVGFMAAALTTLSFLPQAIKTIKSKQTKDLSFGMYLAFTSRCFSLVNLWNTDRGCSCYYRKFHHFHFNNYHSDS